MEEKKKIKVSLSAIVIFILIAIIIGMGFYIYKLNKDKYYMNVGASQQIKELNDKIDDLEDKIKKDENKENNEKVNELEKENNSSSYDEYNEIKFDNDYFLDNGQITKIDEETNQFSSKELGVSFKYPSNFEIQYTVEDSIIIKPYDGAKIEMGIYTIKDNYSEWLDFYENEPWAIRIKDKGDTRFSDYNAHYYRYNLGNGPDDYECKSVFININDNEGYIASFSVDIWLYGISEDLDIVDWEKMEKRQNEKYSEYEPIFDNIISTLKFEK